LSRYTENGKRSRGCGEIMEEVMAGNSELTNVIAHIVPLNQLPKIKKKRKENPIQLSPNERYFRIVMGLKTQKLRNWYYFISENPLDS
jgi:hypothetical protein